MERTTELEVQVHRSLKTATQVVRMAFGMFRFISRRTGMSFWSYTGHWSEHLEYSVQFWSPSYRKNEGRQPTKSTCPVPVISPPPLCSYHAEETNAWKRVPLESGTASSPPLSGLFLNDSYISWGTVQFNTTPLSALDFVNETNALEWWELYSALSSPLLYQLCLSLNWLYLCVACVWTA